MSPRIRIPTPERRAKARAACEAWKERNREYYLAQKRELAKRPEYLARLRQRRAENPRPPGPPKPKVYGPHNRTGRKPLGRTPEYLQQVAETHRKSCNEWYRRNRAKPKEAAEAAEAVSPTIPLVT